jgi:hypothetical protein
VNLLGDNICTIKKYRKTLIDANKEVGLDVNAEKMKYLWLSRCQNASQNHYMKIANSCFVNVAQFKYLGMTITNQNQSQEEIKRRLHVGNDCYNSVQNLLSSCLLYKNIMLATVTRVWPF